MTTIEEFIVPIDDVIDDVGVMVRAKLSMATIADYAAAMRDGAIFPPLDCMRIDGELFVYDGFHRLNANRKNDATEIKVRARVGTYRDAMLAAIRAGAHSKLKFGNADKNKIVSILLADEEWSQWSDRAIAREAGVSGEMVRKLRNAASTANRWQLNSANAANRGKRKGLDGKERRMPKRKPKAPLPTPASSLPMTKLPTFTREQTGLAPSNGDTAKRLEEIQRWGQVHVELPEKRVLDGKQANVKSFSNAVRSFGEAAVKFLAAKGTRIPGTLRGEHGFDPDLATLFTAEEYVQLLGTMQTAQNNGALWRGKFEQHLDALMTALRLLEPFAKALRELPKPPQPEDRPWPIHDDMPDIPDCLKRT